MLRRILLLFGLLLIAAACQDLPTAPEGSARASDRARTIVPEPVVVVAKCDPLTSLDWCGGGGDCMTSTGDVQVIQGCYDSGGGGGGGGTSPGGGGGGGTTGPTPPSDGDPDGPCPIEDPECMQEMSPGQKEAVTIAKSMFKTEFTDPAAQQACTAMVNALATLPIYQGNPLIDDAEITGQLAFCSCMRPRIRWVTDTWARRERRTS